MLLSTYSDHMAIEENARNRFFLEVENAIDWRCKTGFRVSPVCEAGGAPLPGWYLRAPPVRQP